MMTGFVRFNINLCLVAALLAASGGCRMLNAGKKDDKKKEQAMVELHLEVNQDGASDNEAVSINRRDPFTLNVDKTFFLDGGDLADAKLVEETPELFSIQLKFNWRGTILLDSATTANRGKHIAVNCTFGKAHTTRWLAAPVIRKRIADGVFAFTPDASHEEAEQIVRGLTNTVAKIKKDELKW
jgi:hypothetical protein